MLIIRLSGNRSGDYPELSHNRVEEVIHLIYPVRRFLERLQEYIKHLLYECVFTRFDLILKQIHPVKISLLYKNKSLEEYMVIFGKNIYTNKKWANNIYKQYKQQPNIFKTELMRYIETLKDARCI